MKARLALAIFLSASCSFSQLPAPNAAGVSAGHDIFTFHDLPAAQKFWNALGGQSAELGPLKMTKFPGVLFLMRQGDAKGGTEGSTIASLNFKVREFPSITTATPIVQLNRGSFLTGPDDVTVRLIIDKSLPVPIAAEGIDMLVPDPDAAAAWYAKWFGAKIERDVRETIALIPGSNIHFLKATTPVAGTKGRAFDRLGFEVKNVEQFCKNLEAAGIKLDGAFRRATAMKLAVCLFTDPWGTYIEVSEGLAAVK